MEASQPPTATGTDPVASAPLTAQAAPTPREEIEARRSRSKISKLPPPVREKLNQLLDEGVPYEDIIPQLGEPGKDLTKSNISDHYKDAFKQWRNNQIWLEGSRGNLDLALSVIKQNEGASVHQANLHIAANQLIHNLIESGQKLIDEQPRTYVSLVNSVTRLAREAVNFQKYEEACAAARLELAKLKDINRKLSQEETLAIVNHVDEILGFK